jgi:hypothetical protein
MSGKNSSVLSIDPPHVHLTQEAADAAIDALSAAATVASVPASTVGQGAMTVADQPPPAAPLAEFVPNSWPNSGFRNSTRRGTRS